MIVEALRRVIGDAGVLTAAAELERYRSDSVHRVEGGIVCVARPADTGEASRVVAACRAARIAVVPRGGGTGFAGGSLPIAGQNVVVVSLERMRRIRSIDTVGDVVVAEAGCTLHEVQQAALAAQRMLGLDHGGAGSSTIGGNLAANAGGNNVVRYGMARDQLLGIEAVLADGSVLGPPAVLRKSNAGYDLRHLLAGSEGTLALITAAALRLRPAHVARATALFGVASPSLAVQLFLLARSLLGETICAFELMSKSALDVHFVHAGTGRQPIERDSPWLVLIECEATSRFMDLDAAVLELSERATAEACTRDGVFATSESQRRAMWAMREGIAIAMGAARCPIVKTDTAVPIAAVAEFVARTESALVDRLPGARVAAFGHVGDGNIHLNVLPPPDTPDARFVPIMGELARLIEDVALSLGGTVSAEHGIGQGKREALARMLSPSEFALMRAIRRALDPEGVFNPGKIFAAPSPPTVEK